MARSYIYSCKEQPPYLKTNMKKLVNKGSEVNDFVMLVTKNVVGSFETLTKAESFEATAKEAWDKATEAKDADTIASLKDAIIKSATAALKIEEEKDEKLKARKRAKLSKILGRIGIQQRASAPKGPKPKEETIQALLDLVAKLEKTPELQKKAIRAAYDRLLKNDK